MNERSDREAKKAADKEVNESIKEREVVNAKSDDSNDEEQT